jgi:hypothetical protein
MKKSAVVFLACLVQGTAFCAEIPDGYVEWVFPDNVKMGMSTNEVFALRERILRNLPIGSLYRTNAVTFMETGTGYSPLSGYYYYFSDGRLGAVSKTYGHRGTEEGKFVHQKVHETITSKLSRLPDERIFRRVPPAPEPIWKTVELWHDQQSGNHVYFEEDEISFYMIVFDPSKFEHKDFFMDEETYRTKLAPVLQDAQKRIEERERQEKEIRRLQEERK